MLSTSRRKRRSDARRAPFADPDSSGIRRSYRVAGRVARFAGRESPPGPPLSCYRRYKGTGPMIERRQGEGSVRAETALRESKVWLAAQKEAFQAAINGASLPD